MKSKQNTPEGETHTLLKKRKKNNIIRTTSLDFRPTLSTIFRKVLDGFTNCFRLIVVGSFVIMFKRRKKNATPLLP